MTSDLTERHIARSIPGQRWDIFFPGPATGTPFQSLRKVRHVLLFHARQMLKEWFLKGPRQDIYPVLLPFPIRTTI